MRLINAPTPLTPPILCALIEYKSTHLPSENGILPNAWTPSLWKITDEFNALIFSERLFISFIAPVSLFTCTTETKEVLSSIKDSRLPSFTLPFSLSSANLTSAPRAFNALNVSYTALCSPAVVTKLPRLQKESIAVSSASLPQDVKIISQSFGKYAAICPLAVSILFLASKPPL